MKGLILLLIFPFLHPNHISVTEVALNAKTGTMEVTIRLFAEDVENVVRKYNDANFNLDEHTKDGVAKETMANYIADHFKLSVANATIELNFLGMELKDDMILCYLESNRLEKPKTLKIENALLFDLQDEQVNFNHYIVNGETRSVKTTVDIPTAEITSPGR